jgi:hypothetical protein
VVEEKALAEHLAATFAVGSYWGTDRALRDGADVAHGSPPVISPEAPYFREPSRSDLKYAADYWEFNVGPDDESAVRAAAPQLLYLSVRG